MQIFTPEAMRTGQLGKGLGVITHMANVFLSGSLSAFLDENAFEIESYDIFLECGFSKSHYE